MQVIELQERDERAWDQYVYGSPNAAIYHLAGWRHVMRDTFGLEAHFLMARAGGQITGILPLLHVKSTLSGHFFTSMPAAICADDESAAHALVEHAKRLVQAKRARYLILRDSRHRWDLPGLVTCEDHCTFVGKLCSAPDQIWGQLDRRVRQHTKKAIELGLEVMIGPECLGSLYPAYSKAMRDLGTPTLGLKFFQNVMEQFPGCFTTVVVHQNHEVLGGAFVAFFRDTVYNTWGGMLRESYNLRSSHIWYWETLKYACQRQFQWIDLGRSKLNSGAYNFKRLWLAEPQPLYQQCYLNGIDHAPAVGSSMEEDPKYNTFVRIWQKMPLSVTEVLGPQLRKRMPFG